MRVIERSVQEIGKSLLVTLPKGWTRTLNVKKGSVIKMAVSDKGTLVISPEFTLQEREKETSIPYDDNIQRRFYREYFYGNEKITILLKKKLNENWRKELYSFFKRFMNVQIIEESENKIVVKCFRIDELTIPECIRRMYYFTINLMEELLSNNDKIRTSEIEETSKKFYYILVMQIRRFLSEGKFTRENEIPLIKVLDFRITAEKISRISYYLKAIDKLNDKELKNFLLEVKDYYSRSFNYFINDDYEKALLLWDEERKLMNKYDKLKRNIIKLKNLELYEKFNYISIILRYALEISMQVR